MINLDPETVLDLLDKAVADRGADYVYQHIPTRSARGLVRPECLYVDNSTGEQRASCIVGDVLHRAGIGLDMLAEYEGSQPERLLSRMVLGNHITVRPEHREQLSMGLGTAQLAQDHGLPWGECVELARPVIEGSVVYDGTTYAEIRAVVDKALHAKGIPPR